MTKITAILFAILCAVSCARAATIEKTIVHQGKERQYLIHVPSRYDHRSSVPLLFVFHGGAGHAKQIARFTGFNTLADQHTFVVAYPEAIDGHWNDGRIGEAFRDQDARMDDVDFVMQVLKEISKEYSIDPDRIFATGLSNGGIFCQRLAIEHSETFAAVATVIGSIAEPLADNFHPEKPVSILVMNGTADPLVPYSGGQIEVSFAKGWRRSERGKVVSTDRMIELWTKRDGIRSKPVEENLPDTDHDDDASAIKIKWSDPGNPVSVVLYKIVGGGHTYPGGFQYLPKAMVGSTCQDFDASEAIWEFFAQHGR